MQKVRGRKWWRRMAILAGGTSFFLEGCDPTLVSTVENGIITVSQSFLTSFLNAFVQVAAEAVSGTT